MKTLHLAIILITTVCLFSTIHSVAGQCYGCGQNSSALKQALFEKQNPPVIIAQAELDDPYVPITQDVSCSQWNKLANQRLEPYYCTENVVPKEAVECGTSMLNPNLCIPVHLTYNFTNACAFYSGYTGSGIPIIDMHDHGSQWLVLYNNEDTTTNVSNFSMKWGDPIGGSNYDYNYSLILAPHQNCTLSDIFGDSENSTIIIQYNYHGSHYLFKTPLLTDNYHDSRVWQYNGTGWMFTDMSVTVPEFPFAIPVLLVGIASLVVFYRIQIGKFK